jgi:hypothetical protein
MSRVGLSAYNSTVHDTEPPANISASVRARFGSTTPANLAGPSWTNIPISAHSQPIS